MRSLDEVLPNAAHECTRYFHLDSRKQEPIQIQKGTVRTNCMDNLDRTNVAQAALAKWTLNKQLKALRLLVENDNIDNYDDIMKDFQESMWDLMSLSWSSDLNFS